MNIISKKAATFLLVASSIVIVNAQTELIISIAGNQTTGYNGDNILAVNASLKNPNGVAVDKWKNVYIADYGNHRIRKINTSGIISTFAGTGTYGANSPDGVLATLSNISYPAGVAVDTLGNVYFSEGNRVRKVSSNGILTTIAGTGVAGYSGDGALAINATINGPSGLEIDHFGNLYIAETQNSVIRKVGTNGVITTVAGNTTVGFSGDNGLAINASLNVPSAVCVDNSGNIYIADVWNYRIRKVNSSGIITTIVGNGTNTNAGANGLAVNASITVPGGLAIDKSGNLFISTSPIISKIDASGVITTFAGTTAGFSGDGGPAINAQMTNGKIGFDLDNNLYISAGYNIRKVSNCIAPTPSICLITVDSLGNNNEIYWDKLSYPTADSFIVHREVSTNIYKRIGAVSNNAFSMYVDTNRSIGPNNGNPNLTNYKYKLQLLDTCGNYGALGLWHQTIFIQDQQNGNFNWNTYAIEGATATPVSNYTLIRRNLATGTQTIVGNTSGVFFNDPQYATVWTTNIKWHIDAAGFNCNPTAKIAGPNNTLVQKTKTKSNHANDKFAATKLDNLNLMNTQVRVYPNPAKYKVTVELNVINDNMSIELTDILGQTLITNKVIENIHTINTSSCVSGIYFINIKWENKTIAVRKIIVE